MKNIDFIIIGAQKAGTTSLASYLSESDQIFIPQEKELPYFLYKKLNKNGLKYFIRKYFNTKNNNTLLGLSTPQYMMNPSVFIKIKKEMPKVKLIAILRNPVDRLISHYSHAVRLGVETRGINKVIEELINEDNQDVFLDDTTNKYISAGQYGSILKEIFKNFDKSQVMIIDFESFITDTQKNLNRISNFLSIESISIKGGYKVNMKGGLSKKININHDAILNFFSRMLRNFRINNLLPFFIKRPIINFCSYLDMVNVKSDTKIDKSEIRPELLEKLIQFYDKDNKKISKEIALNLSFIKKQNV